MKSSPLNDKHLALNAKMADFGGWMMPIEYPGGGVLAEHAAVRERVGLFDVSHLGKASVIGNGALDFLNRCLTNDLTRIDNGSAQYTLLCAPDGGVVDDLLTFVVEKKAPAAEHQGVFKVFEKRCFEKRTNRRLINLLC